MSSNVEQAATACAAAVQALYGGAPVAQAQANQWLTSFQQSPEAWHVPFVLLAPEQPEEVQFFAATLLVRKVRSEWTKLDAGSRQGLSQATRCGLTRAGDRRRLPHDVALHAWGAARLSCCRAASHRHWLLNGRSQPCWPSTSPPRQGQV